jgi:hypothetical protein
MGLKYKADQRHPAPVNVPAERRDAVRQVFPGIETRA